MGFLNMIKNNVVNIIGWGSKRTIMVFEVDDWGAIRTRSKSARGSMIKQVWPLFSNRVDYF